MKASTIAAVLASTFIFGGCNRTNGTTNAPDPAMNDGSSAAGTASSVGDPDGDDRDRPLEDAGSDGIDADRHGTAPGNDGNGAGQGGTAPGG